MHNVQTRKLSRGEESWVLHRNRPRAEAARLAWRESRAHRDEVLWVQHEDTSEITDIYFSGCWYSGDFQNLVSLFKKRRGY